MRNSTPDSSPTNALEPLRSNETHSTALRWLDLGSSPIPVRLDGSKAPDIAWKKYVQEQPTREKVEEWFGAPRGLGIVTGIGGVELLEFETEAVWVTWCRAMVAAGRADDLSILCDGYLARSGGGGYHLIYRTDVAEGNQKLAGLDQDAAVFKGFENGVIKKTTVLIETRGVGGFVIVAGGHEAVHATGRRYERIRLPEFLVAEQMRNWRLDPDHGVVVLDQARTERGAAARLADPDPLSPAPDHLPVVSADLREVMFSLARQQDRRTPKNQTGTRERASAFDTPGQGVPGARPGDAWAAVTTWDEILQPHGWSRDHSSTESDHWTRPGKTTGTSATTNYGGSQTLYVFTSSTEFEPETSYTKFGAYAVLNHGGDYGAAAVDLVQRGFADPLRSDADTRELRVAQMAVEAEMRMDAQELARRTRASRDMRVPPTRLMADALAAPLPEPAQLVEGLVIGEGVTLLSAQNKTGKSTVGVNLVRAVLHGESLFGKFPTHLPDDAGVGVWNAEVSAATYEKWATDHGIDNQHAKRLAFFHMSGYSVDLLHPTWREQTVAWLREHNVKLWVLDPLSKIFRGDENSATEVNAWWMALRGIMTEADVPAAFVIHHAGHTDDDKRARARGSSAIEGDPEVVLSYRHGGKPGNLPPNSQRYLSGIGRIDDIPSVTLTYDVESRGLSVDEHSRGFQTDREAGEDQAIARIAWKMLAAQGDDAWLSKQQLKDADTGLGARKTIEAIDRCVARGYLVVEAGAPGKAAKVRRGRTRPNRLIQTVEEDE